MKTEIYVYNCPSCGGKVNFNREKNVWECSYCHKSFETVFAKEEQLPKEEEEEKNIYFHHCTKCNKEYTSFIEKEAGCIYCSTKNNSYDSISASIILRPTMDYNNINTFYNEKELYNCPKDYKDEYLKRNWLLEYVNCDILNGILELKYNNKEKKYIFVNLIVPNLDYEDYRFMYELGNSGFKQKTKDSDYGVILLETASKYQNNIKKKTTSHIEAIINTCIDTFQKEKHISDKESIKVINNMKIKTGYYIPIFTKISNIHNTNYYQHILANRDFAKTTYIQYPQVGGSLFKSKLLDALTKLCIILIIACFLFLIFCYCIQQFQDYSVEDLTDLLEIATAIMPVVIFTLPISGILAMVSHKKIDYYYNCTIISKENYYKQIVNNSNYVKIIGGRK